MAEMGTREAVSLELLRSVHEVFSGKQLAGFSFPYTI